MPSFAIDEHLSEDVVEVISTGKEERAATMYSTLKKMFMPANARTKLQVQRDILKCDMRVGEPLVVFLGRIKRLLNELVAMGEVMEDADIMIAITVG